MTGHELERMVRQVYAAAEAAQQILRPLFEQQLWVDEQLRSIAESAQRVDEIFRDFARHSKDIQTRIVPLIEEIGRAFHELPESNRESLRVLAANGWYFDPELPFPSLFQAADLFEEGAVEQANQMLCAHFEQRLDDIQETVCRRFPNRARVLGKALDGHRRGDYALSIPVLLAQSDGICHELVGAQLYARRNGMPLLATYLAIDDGMSLHASFLCPLVEPTPISAGPTERAGLPDLLNRHAILHGESFDYDTRVNGCRSISFLQYVVWVLGIRLEQSARP